MGDVLTFRRPVAAPKPSATDFDVTRFLFIASLADQLAQLMLREDPTARAAIADMAERGKTMIVGIASMEPDESERAAVQAQMKSSLPYSA